LNTPGTIDADYRGEIKVILINHGQKAFIVTRGLRIAQMVVAKYERLTITEVDDLDDTVRGSEASDPPELKECCMYPLVDTHDGLTDEQTSVIDDFVIHDRNVVLRANYGSGKRQ
jgi:hypothetical protein